MKPDCYQCYQCYQCQYRGDVPGSAHSSCHHPACKPLLDSSLGQVLGMLASVRRTAPLEFQPAGIKVVGDSHGIKNGWFNHPYNFDPVWLEECSGFEPIKKKRRRPR